MKTTRLLTIAAALIAGAMAMADVSVTTKAGGGYDLFRASTKLSHWANKPECEAARDRDAEARKIATANYSCREVWDTYAVKYVPPAAPIDCAVSDWGTWQAPSMTSMCTGTTGMLMGSEVRKRTITRQPANGGAACPALEETREVHQACGSSVPIVAIPPRGTAAAYSVLRAQATEETVWHDATRYGAFRSPCPYSHMAYDDPIVFPGQPGKSHLHVFFGNTSVDANTTQESLDAGSSTCAGGTANRSSYWVPAIIDTGLGKAVVPDATLTYYKDGYFAPPMPMIAPPKGLRMIGGNPVTWDREITWDTTPNLNNVHVFYECWWSKTGSGDWTDRSGKQQHIPAGCPVGGEILFEVYFPYCWDGVHLDSADHRSHMSFPPSPTLPCPASHPVAIPSISFNIHIPVKAGNDTSKWRLSSDAYDASKPGGYSGHGDVWVDWDEGIEQEWFKGCILAGADCHAHMLGDHRMLY